MEDSDKVGFVVVVFLLVVVMLLILKAVPESSFFFIERFLSEKIIGYCKYLKFRFKEIFCMIVKLISLQKLK